MDKGPMCAWGVTAKSARKLTQSLTANSTTTETGIVEKACLRGERVKQRLHDIIAKQMMGKKNTTPKHPTAQQQRVFVTPRTQQKNKTLTQDQLDLTHYQKGACSSTASSPKSNKKHKNSHLFKHQSSSHSLMSWREATQSSPKTNLRRKKYKSEGDILACGRLARLPKEREKEKKTTHATQDVVRRIVGMFKIKK